MARCHFCGRAESLPFTCKFCGEKFCSDHRLPENHQCPGLEEFKKNITKVDEWIYEPFRADRKREVGRERKPALTQWSQPQLSRKLLYAVVVLILLLAFYKSFTP